MSDEFETEYFPKRVMLEADGLYTSVLEYPKGDPDKYAFVLEHHARGLRLYFFLDKAQVQEVISVLLDQIGRDA